MEGFDLFFIINCIVRQGMNLNIYLQKYKYLITTITIPVNIRLINIILNCSVVAIEFKPFNLSFAKCDNYKQ